MARKKLSDVNVIRDAGLFAGAEFSPSGSSGITTIECFSMSQVAENQLVAKLEDLEKEAGTRYSTLEGARSHLKNLMRS